MKSIKIFFVTVLILHLNMLSAQEAEENTKDNRPVRSPFESGILIDNYTTVLPNANTLEFLIQHRFGTLNSESFDLLGLYAPSNIRIGLSYGITKKINIGIGTTKRRKLQDVNLKVNILDQTRSGSIPVSVTYYGLYEYDARTSENFGIEYSASNRLSYYHELLISRKFNSNLSLQASVNYSHLNQVDTAELSDMVHDNIGLSLCGRYKFTSSMAALFSYNQSLTTPKEIEPAYGLGIEIGTSAHAFQIFLTTADAISRQRIQTSNINDISNNDMMIGFNITRLWYF